MHRSPTWIPLLLLPCFACGAEAPDAEPRLEASRDTVDGVERLTFGDGPAAPLGWGFDTTAVIGGFGTDDADFQFGGVSRRSLADDSDGNIYLFDADGVRVLGFTPAGEFLGSWGREGGGPGEFAGAFGRGIAIGPGDTLWVADTGNQRYTLIPLRGGDPTSIPLDQSARGVGSFVVDTRGAVALLSSFSFSPGSTDRMPPRPLTRIDRNGETSDTLFHFPAPPTDMVTITTGGNRLMMMMSQVWAPGAHWERFSDGGIAVHSTADYEIRIVDGDGKLERIIRRDIAPRPVTEAHRAAYLDSLRTPPEEESQFDTAELREKRAEATTFADVIPWVVALRIDGADRLWVGVSEDRPNSIDRIDVYDRSGSLLGELRDVPLPDVFFGDGSAVIIDEDDFDVQQLHVLRLSDTVEELESAG